MLIFNVFYSPPNSPMTSGCVEKRSKLLCIMSPALSGPGFLWGFGSCLATQPHHAIGFLIIFICKVIHPFPRGVPQPCSVSFGKTYMFFNIQELCVTLLFLKWITNKNLLYSTRNSAQCYVLAWMGEEGFGGEWIHVYVWLSPFALHLKLLQHD